MAHHITDRDGVFSVREPMWHGLGTVFEEYPTREQAQALAHPWEPVSEPLYRAVPDFEEREHPATFGERETGLPHLEPVIRYEKVEGFVANVRSDTGETLGVVSDTYETVLNAEMYDIAEAIEGEAKGSVKFETGGSLKGGAKVWLLIRLRDPLVLREDPQTATIPYYALQNSHDASGAFRGQATMTRIVCDNTSQMADMDARQRGTEFIFHHTKNVRDRIEEAKAALAGWRESVQAYRLMSEHLLSTRITGYQEAEFVERFIPMPPPHTVSERVVNNVEAARSQMWEILRGPTLDNTGLTAYSLVQASVEYLNHYRKARSAETRFRRAYLDRNRIVTDAVNLVKEIAHV